MTDREIAEFLAERFRPSHISNLDEAYSFKHINNGYYVVDRTWRQHLIEQYMDDAQAFLLLLETNRLEIREKPVV